MNIVNADDLAIYSDGSFDGFIAFQTYMVHAIEGNMFENYVENMEGHVSLSTIHGEEVCGPVNKGAAEAALSTLEAYIERTWVEGEGDLDYAEYLEMD